MDYSEVATWANSQPEAQLHDAGIGVGRHCIPVYPHLFLATDPEVSLLQSSRAINERRPQHYADIAASVVRLLQCSTNRRHRHTVNLYPILKTLYVELVNEVKSQPSFFRAKLRACIC